MKVQEYITDKTHTFTSGPYDEKTLPAGSFVKPIHVSYLPAHIKQSTNYHWFDPKTHIYVYCSLGIIEIPLKIIREC